MAVNGYLPHLDLLLRIMRISRERLMGSSKIAVDTQVIRALIRTAAAGLAFDPEFYRATYPDIDAGYLEGKIPDLHRHFVESGIFEGRAGAAPDVDEAFYVKTYGDVAEALQRGEVASAQDHYVRSGAAEGRTPSPALSPEVDAWSALLSGRIA